MFRTRTLALGTASLAVLAVSAAVPASAAGTGTTTGSTTSSTTSSTDAVAVPGSPNPFPMDCAWGGEVSPTAANVYYPDSGATYWVTPYTVDAGTTIEVDGTFPDARYGSLVTYPSSGGYFTTDAGVESWITDHEIVPDPGSVNPFTAEGAGAEPGGDFTVEVAPEVGADAQNTLPMAPDGDYQGETGFLVYRVYEPAGGDYDAVDLPELTLHTESGSTTLPECDERTEVDRVPPDPVEPRESTEFARQPLASAFPNPDNSYLTLDYQVPTNGDVTVVHGKAPTQSGGQEPVTWPSSEADVRYWSMCNNTMTNPYPVVEDGCLTDDQTVLDENGYYTYVIGTEEQRAQLEAIPGVNFIPTSSTDPEATHKLVLRNMLPSEEFAEAITSAPEESTPEEAAGVMGEYYPQTYTLSATTLAEQGLDAID
jgi:hypothetical protein